MSVVFYNLNGTKNKELTTGNIITKTLRYSDIKIHYENGDFIIPDFQRDLDDDKIDELVKEIENDCNYLLHRTNPIQLACNVIGENKCKYYIIDGQHRIHAILRLADKYPDYRQNIVATMCDNEDSIMEIFKKLIKEKDNQYLLNTENLNRDFCISREYKLRQILRQNFSHHFIKSERNKYIYSIEGFLRELSEGNVFKLTKLNDGNKMITGIFKVLKKFVNKVDYKSMVKETPDKFYKIELDYLIKCDYMPLGLKNNNFIRYLCTKSDKNERITPVHKFSKKIVIKKVENKKKKTEKSVKKKLD